MSGGAGLYAEAGAGWKAEAWGEVAGVEAESGVCSHWSLLKK